MGGTHWTMAKISFFMFFTYSRGRGGLRRPTPTGRGDKCICPSLISRLAKLSACWLWCLQLCVLGAWSAVLRPCDYQYWNQKNNIVHIKVVPVLHKVEWADPWVIITAITQGSAHTTLWSSWMTLNYIIFPLFIFHKFCMTKTCLKQCCL